MAKSYVSGRVQGGGGINQAIHDLRKKICKYIRRYGESNILYHQNKIYNFKQSDPNTVNELYDILKLQYAQDRKLHKKRYKKSVGQRLQNKANSWFRHIITFSDNMIKDYQKNPELFHMKMMESMEALEKLFGAEIAYSVLHLDEKTPHIHLQFRNFDMDGKSIQRRIKQIDTRLIQDTLGQIWGDFETGYVRGEKKEVTNANHLQVVEMHQAERDAIRNLLESEKQKVIEIQANSDEQQLKIGEQLEYIKQLEKSIDDLTNKKSKEKTKLNEIKSDIKVQSLFLDNISAFSDKLIAGKYTEKQIEQWQSELKEDDEFYMLRKSILNNAQSFLNNINNTEQAKENLGSLNEDIQKLINKETTLTEKIMEKTAQSTNLSQNIHKQNQTHSEIKKSIDDLTSKNNIEQAKLEKIESETQEHVLFYDDISSFADKLIKGNCTLEQVKQWKNELNTEDKYYTLRNRILNNAQRYLNNIDDTDKANVNIGRLQKNIKKLEIQVSNIKTVINEKVTQSNNLSKNIKKQNQVQTEIERSINEAKKLLSNDAPIPTKVIDVKITPLKIKPTTIPDLSLGQLNNMKAIYNQSQHKQHKAFEENIVTKLKLKESKDENRNLIKTQQQTKLLLKVIHDTIQNYGTQEFNQIIDNKICQTKNSIDNAQWRENLYNTTIRQQRAFFVIYKTKITQEKIENYDIFSSDQVTTFVHKDASTVIYDLKNEDKIVVDCEVGNEGEAICLALEIAQQKGWDLDKIKVTGSKEFKQKVEQEIYRIQTKKFSENPLQEFFKNKSAQSIIRGSLI